MIKKLVVLAQKLFSDTGAILFLVGGAVRDMVTGHHSKDFDLEVFKINPEDFIIWLESEGIIFELEPNAKFPVIRFKLDGEEIEVGFPRRDNKVGPRHSDYIVSVDTDMPFEEAALRRDFTFNAMGYNLTTQEIVDPFNGSDDLKNSVIRPCSIETFREDSLRIFRAMQFIARFNIENWDEVVSAIDQQMVDELKHIDPSSVFPEFRKMIDKGSVGGIQLALRFLLDISQRHGILPIVSWLADTEQSPVHHAEGNVFNHTANVVKHAPKSMLFFLTALCHDMGKVTSSKIKNGKIVAYGHEKDTAAAVDFLKTIGAPKKLMEQVLKLVSCHMLTSTMSDKKWCRLADELSKQKLLLSDFLGIKKADTLGSLFQETGQPETGDLEKIEATLSRLGIINGPLPRLVSGKDVMEIRSVSGKAVGDTLTNLRNIQYTGQINTREEALAWLKKYKR